MGCQCSIGFQSQQDVSSGAVRDALPSAGLAGRNPQLPVVLRQLLAGEAARRSFLASKFYGLLRRHLLGFMDC